MGCLHSKQHHGDRGGCEVGDTIVPRVAVFVSSFGVGGKLKSQLTGLDVPIFRSTKTKGHAESAARSFREDPTGQKRVLGGEMGDIEASVQTIHICSADCEEDHRIFEGVQKVRIPELTAGRVGNYLLDRAGVDNLRQEVGNGRAFPVITRAFEEGIIGGNPAGSGANQGFDEE
jgi:hypothetical protein